MKTLQTKIRICAAVMLAVLLVGLGVYFVMPHRITVPDGEEIRVEYTVATLSVDEGTSTTGWETSEYHFSPGDEGYDEFVDTLEEITYHNCFRTLSGSTGISNVTYVVNVRIGDECYSFYDRGYLIADKIYYVSKNSVGNIRCVIETNM
ncbi:MAG: hypothetical protein LIO49_06995 [Ruminococcus sp.]|nr:hypothetical protein [Ruminococcus sp.]